MKTKVCFLVLFKIIEEYFDIKNEWKWLSNWFKFQYQDQHYPLVLFMFCRYNFTGKFRIVLWCVGNYVWFQCFVSSNADIHIVVQMALATKVIYSYYCYGLQLNSLLPNMTKTTVTVVVLTYLLLAPFMRDMVSLMVSTPAIQNQALLCGSLPFYTY